MRTLTLDPAVPASLWALMAVVSAAAIVLYVFFRPPAVSRARRAVVGVLLALLLAGVLAVLLNPTWEELRREDLGRPTLNIVMDRSGSMDTPDCDGASRLEAVQKDADRIAKGLADTFDVRFWAFSERAVSMDSDALGHVESEGVATNIGTSLGEVLRTQTPGEAAVIFLSDGIHNVPDALPMVWESVQTAQAMAVPIYTRTLGADGNVADVQLQAATPDDVVFPNQEATVRARILHPGVPPGTRIKVFLRNDAGLVATREVVLSDKAAEIVEFPVTAPASGVERYMMEAQPLPHEVVRTNNADVVYLRVCSEPIRVLVLEGKPYWDVKFLVRELSSAEGVIVSSAVRLKDGRMVMRTVLENPKAKEGEVTSAADEKLELVSNLSALIGTYEQLKNFDVIILGRDVDALLNGPTVERLCRWVAEWGGSLVCARGRPMQLVPAELDRVLPVRWTSGRERRFRITPGYEASWMGWLPAETELMPSLATDAAEVTPKALAAVAAKTAAEGPETEVPVIAFQRYGAGRVLTLEGSGTWRWAFMPPTSPGSPETVQQQVYRRFWSNMLRWLIASGDFLPGETICLRPKRTTSTELDRVVLEVLFRDESTAPAGGAPVVEIAQRNGPADEEGRRVPCVVGDTPGAFRATCGVFPRGSYTARLVGAPKEHPITCGFEVVEPASERLNLRAQPGLMKRIAELSGGTVLTEDATTQVEESYRAYWKERHPERIKRVPAWDRKIVLLILAVIAAALWIVRRRGGLT